MEAKKGGIVPELDLVFVCDCTGSMGSYIESAKANITSIIEQIQASEQRDVQFALVSYRDHPPQDRTYVTKVFDFTPSVRKAKEYVSTMAPAGGGDTPEAVTAALHAALELPYRKQATKIIVFVADAPCHGLTSYTHDGFPNGSPDGHDPLVDARALAERNIVLYAVGCEPALGNAAFARDFFKAIAGITGGRYISLGNANILPKVIIGGAEEEINLTKISDEVDKEAELVKAEAEGKGETLAEEVLYSRVTERLQSRGIETAQLQVDDIGDSEDSTVISRKIAECDTLAAAKEMLDKEPNPRPSGRSVGGGRLPRVSRMRAASSRTSSLECDDEDDCASVDLSVKEESVASAPAPMIRNVACQEARVENSKISYSQVSRMMSKKKYSSPFNK